MTATVTEPRVAIRPRTKWINLADAKAMLVLPEPWALLESQDFHADLTNRAYAHSAYAANNAFADNAYAVLFALGNGFIAPFDRSRFEPRHNDENLELKSSALDALDELAAFYGDRISSVVWESLAHLACREDPEVEKSIIKEAASGTLPHHYMLVDSALHATGLVYTFLLHVNSVMFKHTGRILVHNCDCNCSLVNLETIGGRIEYTPPRQNVVAMTQSVFTHLLAETVKLMECFLPFAYSITPEAYEIKALL
jgi:hypothetical protein